MSFVNDTQAALEAAEGSRAKSTPEVPSIIAKKDLSATFERAMLALRVFGDGPAPEWQGRFKHRAYR